MEKEQIRAIIDDMGLSVTAVFVPQSQSRNRDEKHKSINWRVTVSRHDKPFLTTDYMQGIAHMPQYKQFWGKTSLAERDEHATRIQYASEKGQTFDRFWGGSPAKIRPLPAPDIVDVMYCFVLDSDVLDYGAFEDWASCYGYDVDSREAEKIYHACLKIALKLLAAIGNDNFSKLREAFRDY